MEIISRPSHPALVALPSRKFAAFPNALGLSHIQQTAGLQRAAISGAFRVVRFIIFLFASTCSLKAEMIARFQTSQGVVDAILQYQKTPQTVANFVTLVEGSRPWIDPKTGVIVQKPFYDGTKIIRTEAGAFAQGGSRIGDASDGPGYTIKDEFDDTLTHVPYVLSMGNKGPNTNGSGFFFTGNVTIPVYDRNYSLFGIVNDPASRAVVDAMIAAGPNGTTIHLITILRTDAAAAAFDEHAQNLPVVSCPGGRLTVNPGVGAIWNFDPLISTGAVFHAFYSTTMAPDSWEELDFAQLHVGISQGALLTPVATVAPLDNAAAPRAFYNLYVAEHPGSVAPSYLKNRTVTIPFTDATLRYDFDNSGIAGTTTFTETGGSPIISPFITVNPGNGQPVAPTSDAHSIQFAVEHTAGNLAPLWFRIGCDSATNSLVTGRQSTQLFGFFGWQPFATGPVTITR
jgi:cyclophilin family peptidyl-prolyl cis-trans isomerase